MLVALALLAPLAVRQVPPPLGPLRGGALDRSAPAVDDHDLVPGGAPRMTGIRAMNVQSGGESFFVHLVAISTGTGFPEFFFLHAPTQYPATPAPLVTVFHQFGKSHADVLNTEFVQAAHERGWYLVCPLGGSKKHMSSVASQLNTEAVLAWMLAQPAFNIDPDRLYAVGFSMGGGAALNYAARHKDLSAPRFAAVVDHTGTISNVNAYADDCVYFACASQFVWDFWFGDGGAGSARTWDMARSSVLDYDGDTLQVVEERALARNLMDGTAVQIVRGDMDFQVPYLVEQTDVLNAYMMLLGAQPGAGYDYFVLPYSTHDWGLLDEGAVLDWLAPYTLQTPTAGDTIADRNGSYYYFEIVQDGPGEFTPFQWSIGTVANSVAILETSNLTLVSVDTSRAALDTGIDLVVDVGTADGLRDVVRVSGYSAPPTAVLRDGQPASSWSHDPLLSLVELVELDGAPHTWTIQP